MGKKEIDWKDITPMDMEVLFMAGKTGVVDGDQKLVIFDIDSEGLELDPESEEWENGDMVI